MLQLCDLKIIIGDGDSSVMKRLHEVLPYGPNFLIHKIECRNHLLRNYCQKLTALANKTEYVITLCKYILSNIMKFRSDITKAAEYRRNANNISLTEQITSNININ